MTTPMKLIIAILLMLLIGAGFYMFDWSEKWDRLKNAQASLQQKQDELKGLEEDIKELPKIQQQVLEKQQELNKVVSQGTGGAGAVDESPDQFVSNYLGEVERLIVQEQKDTGDYSLSIKTLSPGNAQATAAPASGGDKGGAAPAAPAETPEAMQAFQTRTFGMTLDGRYATLVDLMYQLGNMKLNRLVTINSLRMTRSGDASTPGATLSIDLPVTAYLRTGTQ